MYDKIPFLLKNAPQWVCVKNNSKIPFEPISKTPASPSNPNTWVDFETAKNSVEKGKYDGIGYVFNDTGIVGIDIDEGFDEDGKMTPLALDIIFSCCSYTELSRSGRGMHIFIKADIPFKGKNNLKGVEIYKVGRYFITTGKQMFFRQISSNQQPVDYVLERYFAKPELDLNEEWEEKIYAPVFQRPRAKISLSPSYPPVGEGGRNMSMASLAGQLHSARWNKKQIYAELLKANKEACDPPLKEREIIQIVNSITRYDR